MSEFRCECKGLEIACSAPLESRRALPGRELASPLLAVSGHSSCFKLEFESGADFLWKRGVTNPKDLLLMIDAIINLILGAVLLFVPRLTIEFLGLPAENTYFYPSILGAVLFGIGIALLMVLSHY